MKRNLNIAGISSGLAGLGAIMNANVSHQITLSTLKHMKNGVVLDFLCGFSAVKFFPYHSILLMKPKDSIEHLI